MNYKRVTLTVLTFFIAIYITLVTAYAQEIASSSIKEPFPTAIEYQLPYPGLLPDNPLYFLKVFRDNLTAFFLSKPLDKANFDLLQSDKNTEASYLLITQEVGKTELALKIFTQGQDFFEDAIKQTTDAKKQGYSSTEMSKKLATANLKHMQILQSLEQQSGQKNAKIFQDEREQGKKFAKMIRALQ